MTHKTRILLVEDHRILREGLRAILNGQEDFTVVGEAADGGEAIRRAQELQPDLVVLDLSMPRMNGFNLTEKIRGDKKLAELPVVLVTALGSREDRERGIDVGANAYIVKSSFDQSNLLETLRRLL